MSRTQRVRRRRSESGQASIEMVAYTVVLLPILLLMLQLIVFVYTAHGAAQAAREGARAYSLGQPYAQAARDATPGGLTVLSVDAVGPDHGVKVTVEAPPVLVVMPNRVVSRTVTMP